MNVWMIVLLVVVYVIGVMATLVYAGYSEEYAFAIGALGWFVMIPLVLIFKYSISLGEHIKKIEHDKYYGSSK